MVSSMRTIPAGPRRTQPVFHGLIATAHGRLGLWPHDPHLLGSAITRRPESTTPTLAALATLGYCGRMSQIPDHLQNVGRGWHPLLTQLHADLLGVDLDYRVSQVKEKFGALRVYIQSPFIQRHDLIAAAELASQYICETCGQPGTNAQGPTGWWSTLCEACRRSDFEAHARLGKDVTKS
jgi:hypothetical protein